MANFTLVVSQYYHSRHCFIVHHKPDFLEKAKSFAIELMGYKRDENRRYSRAIDSDEALGDLSYKWNNESEIRRRYNINDSGDIYFIQSDYANYLMWQALEFKEDSRRESRGFQKKAITEDIEKHHNYNKVKEILEKYFEIA